MDCPLPHLETEARIGRMSGLRRLAPIARVPAKGTPAMTSQTNPPIVCIEAEHFERRRRKVATQVYDLPSCGSVWKNPGAGWGTAWELVDAVGMRGARTGGAQITEKHANFIANLDRAKAEHVLALMRETRRRVLEQVGVALEPEIRFWGFETEELECVGAVS